MPVPEQDTSRGLPFTAKLVVGVLALVGAVSIVRWILNGLFGLLFFALVLAAGYVAVKVLSRR